MGHVLCVFCVSKLSGCVCVLLGTATWVTTTIIDNTQHTESKTAQRVKYVAGKKQRDHTASPRMQKINVRHKTSRNGFD